MAVYFLDTSAAVKRYILETGTAWMRALADPALGHFLYLARITDVETTAALARRRRQGSLTVAEAAAASSQFRKDLGQDYRIAEITIPLVQQAARLADAHVLRAYDSVQLSAALEVHRLYQSTGPGAVTLLSADMELNIAARAEGLQVEDPNTHP